ncbi:hypothetical protein QE152_g25795 [Popillia japonica]|uniref:Uncharacterized protein n=1 Tax=Popillia japonica TaxID=7064 RepID=A0AAW1K019_POPJA
MQVLREFPVSHSIAFNHEAIPFQRPTKCLEGHHSFIIFCITSSSSVNKTIKISHTHLLLNMVVVGRIYNNCKCVPIIPNGIVYTHRPKGRNPEIAKFVTAQVQIALTWYKQGKSIGGHIDCEHAQLEPPLNIETYCLF